MNSFPCRRNGFAGFLKERFSQSPYPHLALFMLIVIYDKDFKIECYQSVHVAVDFLC